MNTTKYYVIAAMSQGIEYADQASAENAAKALVFQNGQNYTVVQRLCEMQVDVKEVE